MELFVFILDSQVYSSPGSQFEILGLGIFFEHEPQVIRWIIPVKVIA